MRKVELADVEGWLDTHTGTWHALRTCARSPATLLPLPVALANGHHLCQVCCSSRRWYDDAMEVQE